MTHVESWSCYDGEHMDVDGIAEKIKYEYIPPKKRPSRFNSAKEDEEHSDEGETTIKDDEMKPEFSIEVKTGYHTITVKANDISNEQNILQQSNVNNDNYQCKCDMIYSKEDFFVHVLNCQKVKKSKITKNKEAKVSENNRSTCSKVNSREFSKRKIPKKGSCVKTQRNKKVDKKFKQRKPVKNILKQNLNINRKQNKDNKSNDKQYQCNTCVKNFANKGNLNRHLKSIHNKQPNCLRDKVEKQGNHKKSAIESNLQSKDKKQQKATKKTKTQCYFCNGMYSYVEGHYRSHHNIDRPEDLLFEDGSSIINSSMRWLRRFKYMMREKKYEEQKNGKGICKICGANVGETYVNDHYDIEHKIIEDKREIVDRLYRFQRSSLIEPTSILLYSCKSCKLSLSTYDDAITHSQRHVALKDYYSQPSVVYPTCKECDFKFEKLDCYNQHLILHNESNVKLQRAEFNHNELFGENWLDHLKEDGRVARISEIDKAFSIYRYTTSVKMRVKSGSSENMDDCKVRFQCDTCNKYIHHSEVKAHARSCRTAPPPEEPTGHTDEGDDVTVVSFNDRADDVFNESLRSAEDDYVSKNPEQRVTPIRLQKINDSDYVPKTRLRLIKRKSAPKSTDTGFSQSPDNETRASISESLIHSVSEVRPDNNREIANSNKIIIGSKRATCPSPDGTIDRSIEKKKGKKSAMNIDDTSDIVTRHDGNEDADHDGGVNTVAPRAEVRNMPNDNDQGTIASRQTHENESEEMNIDKFLHEFGLMPTNVVDYGVDYTESSNNESDSESDDSVDENSEPTSRNKLPTCLVG